MKQLRLMFIFLLGLAATGAVSPHGAVTTVRVESIAPQSSNWSPIGHANNVRALAIADNGKLYAATRDNQLWERAAQAREVNWRNIGHANQVTAMDSTENILFAVTGDSRLWARNLDDRDTAWRHIGHANHVVGFAAVPGKLFVATSDGQLWTRNTGLQAVNWSVIGHARNVIAMAGAADSLYVVTSDGRLWRRDTQLRDRAWQVIGSANGVVALAASTSALYVATSDNRLWMLALGGAPPAVSDTRSATGCATIVGGTWKWFNGADVTFSSNSVATVIYTNGATAKGTWNSPGNNQYRITWPGGITDTVTLVDGGTRLETSANRNFATRQCP